MRSSEMSTVSPRFAVVLEVECRLWARKGRRRGRGPVEAIDRTECLHLGTALVSRGLRREHRSAQRRAFGIYVKSCIDMPSKNGRCRWLEGSSVEMAGDGYSHTCKLATSTSHLSLAASITVVCILFVLLSSKVPSLYY